MLPERITVGTCGKAHGVKGEVVVFTDVPEVFVPGGIVQTGGGESLTITSIRNHHQRLLVAFEGVEDRNAAQAMRNVELSVAAEKLPALEENEYWVAALIGRRVRSTEGEDLGEVKSVELGPQDRLVIRTARGDVEVPFVAALVPEVSAEYIVVDPPPGLFDPT